MTFEPKILREHPSILDGKRTISISEADWRQAYEPGDLMVWRVDVVPPHDPACIWSQLDDGKGRIIFSGI